jgi:hypothetical protein
MQTAGPDSSGENPDGGVWPMQNRPRRRKQPIPADEKALRRMAGLKDLRLYLPRCESVLLSGQHRKTVEFWCAAQYRHNFAL